MPELPEVESTVQYLKERVTGLSIEGATVLWDRTIALTSPHAFCHQLAGSQIADVFRRGKLVGLRIVGKREQYLYTHLRMSGSLDVMAKALPIAPHDRVVIFLSNGKTIRFNDTRKFGRMYLTTSPDDVVAKLGIEPLSPEFTADALRAMLSSKKGAIKPLLLNQSFIAGLGNIYVDESLWRAKIHPLTPANRVPSPKQGALHEAIRAVLSEAVSLLGTDFGDGVVDGGMYTPAVYGQNGQPCGRCGTVIRRVVVGQRGTHLCPSCQRKPRS